MKFTILVQPYMQRRDEGKRLAGRDRDRFTELLERLIEQMKFADKAGYYAMCAPGFEPRATIALPTATIGPMSAEASVNAVYANKVAAITDDDERAAYVAARTVEQQADINLLRMASDLVVDSVVEPEDLRGELVARFSGADRFTRSTDRRHHLISPV